MRGDIEKGMVYSEVTFALNAWCDGACGRASVPHSNSLHTRDI